MKIKPPIQAMLLMITLIVMLTLPAYAFTEPNHLQQQIERLSIELEAKRNEYRIPGMAIAVVKDDKIIIAQGFGVMDIEQKTPVTAETVFSIGSSSKAFTATMVGMYVDQNKLAWDDLVTAQLPDYQFTVDGDVLPITYRDMLSHRTGYTRNDLLWANGKASKALILKTAAKAEPVDAFRKNFYYNNVMYLAAGEAMAKLSDSSWDALLNDLILQPLGMNNTTSIHEIAESSPHISLGYQWNEETEQHDLMPRRNLNNVAPAGGIYSNVNDMAQWIKFQLNQGKVNQQPLISQQQLQATHQAQIDIASTVDYGMGWMLRKWQNRPVIEHGGNIDGYGAQVALLPDEKLGFVLLTNLTATPLQQESINMVWRHLATQEEIKETKTDYQEFVGEYHANFGPFKDAIFTFLIKDNGSPAVDVPGQTVYELLDPDETGKWYFKVTNSISVSFDLSKQGNVAAMRMQQNGMNFELPRKGYNIEPEVDTGTFNQYLGSYESKKLNGHIKALIQNHRLTMDVPNQMAFELQLPDENGFREFRIKSDTSVKFVKNEAGVVTAVQLYKNKIELVETAPKLEDTVVEALPSVNQIMELRQSKSRIKALKKNDGFELTGVINIKSSGITGQLKTQFDAKSSYKKLMDFGVFGQIITVVNKKHGSTYGINPYTKLTGKYLKQAMSESPLASIDWQNHYDEIKVLGRSEINQIPVYAVLLKQTDLPVTTAYVDIENGDLVKIKTKLLIPSVGAVGVQITYADYREQHGLRIPFKTSIKNPMMGEMEIIYHEFKNKQKFKRSVFDTRNPDKI
ncbi:serine hydrolase domain-containing protein [Marinicella litoralis]|uniref:CubicO group peptidase (Beta-lactamase class C family) n=1 Tax=Marinicella litoralis TaxID=644220 RepID=A0A4R6XSX4_9GAMM|nr:serine hydrolase domain-containing protein [Marinicella litoralis]TDR19458.1 CubicO group peptidase (beta-lactamase class C family) [Marinicella litoralis]